MTMSSINMAPDQLTPDQHARLQSLLLALLVEQAEQMTEHRATVDELTGQGDPDSLLERELAEASAIHASVAMDEMQEALRRLDEGAYGVCEGCARPIPYERLEAIPQTRRCVECPAAPRGLLG